jgi:hypothetical protein
MFNYTETNFSLCLHGVHREKFTFTLLFDLILHSAGLVVSTDWQQHICNIRAKKDAVMQ